MKADRIIFPTDFSKDSAVALPLATSLAKQTGALLLIVHVSEPPMVYGGGDQFFGVIESNEPEQRQMLRDVKPADQSVRCEHRLLHGDPATAIADLANDIGADLIVMGTHGRTGFNRLVMGSVAEAVMRHAPCPVLTMRGPRTGEQQTCNPSSNATADADAETSAAHS